MGKSKGKNMIVLCECIISKPTLTKPKIFKHVVGIDTDSSLTILYDLKKRIGEKYGHGCVIDLICYMPQCNKAEFNTLKLTH